jgi:hypothetical protein
MIELSSESEFKSCIDNNSHSLTDMIELTENDITSLNKIIKDNRPLEVICKFDDGQRLDMFKEYRSFEEIIKDIPEK